MSVEARLRAIGEEIAREETELRVLDEQLVHQSDVAEDARIRALVSETPLADREAQETSRDLDRLVRARDDLRARLESLRTEQDSLLERMLDRR